MNQFTLDYFDITALVKTKQDAAELNLKLTELITSLYSIKETEDEILSKHFPYEDKKNLISLMNKNKVEPTNPSLLKEFFIFLKEYLESMPVATLYIAFVPQTETIETISEWFYVAIKKEVLLDIHIDKSILGGAIISYKGIYKDLSIRKSIHEEFGKQSLST